MLAHVNYTLSASQELIDSIKAHEGLRLKAYIPVKNDAWTIGYGHTGRDVYQGLQITKDDAERLLRNDLERFEYAVRQIKVPLNQHQFDALVSFTYNIGVGAFNRSTLLTEINKGNYDAVPHQLSRWVYSSGVKYRGLIKRRQYEANIFNGIDTPIYQISDAMPQCVECEPKKKISQVIKDSRTAKSGLGLAGLASTDAIMALKNTAEQATQAKDSLLSFMPNIEQYLPFALIALGIYVVYLKVSDNRKGRAY